MHKEMLLDHLRSLGFHSLVQIAGGNVATGVFRATHPQGDQVVVKLAVTEADRQEIMVNVRGYARIRALGGASLLPDRLDVLDVCGSSALVMSDCGKDFRHFVQELQNPIEAYTRLVEQMMRIYQTTLVKASSRDVLEHLRSQIQRVLMTAPLQGLVERTDLEAFQACRLDDLLPAYNCFADFNFTPENVFFTDGRLRYIDPSEFVVGIPIIDLACFAGVADVYALPGHVEGASLLQVFATQGALPDLLEMTNAEARRVYTLGRVLQTAHSAKYRIQKTPDVGQRLVRECVEHLRAFVRSEEVSGE